MPAAKQSYLFHALSQLPKMLRRAYSTTRGGTQIKIRRWETVEIV